MRPDQMSERRWRQGLRVCLVLALTAVGLVALPGTASATSTVTWTGKGDGTTWGDGGNWDSSQPPEEGDDVIIQVLPSGPSHVTRTPVIKLGALTLGKGSSITGGKLTLAKGLTWTGGLLRTDVVVEAPTVSTISGDEAKDLDGSLTLNGATVAGGDGPLRMFGNSPVTNNGAFAARAPFGVVGMVCCTDPPRFINAGVLSVTPLLPGIPGRVRIAAAPLVQQGTIDVAGAATLELSIAQSSFAAGSSMSGAGRTVLVNTFAPATMSGAVSVLPGATFELAEAAELGGSGTFTGGGTFEWSGGEFLGVHTVAASTKTTITGTARKGVTTGVGAGGKLTLAGPTTAAAPGPIVLAGPATLTNTGTFTATGGLEVQGTVCCITPAVFANSGTFVVRPGAGAVVAVAAAAFANSGEVRLESGTLKASVAGYRQTAGRTVLAGGGLASDKPVNVAGGTLAGVGTVAAPLTNAGVVAPGPVTPPGAVGKLTVTGDYIQQPAGTLQIDLRGATAGTGHDQLSVGGAASFAGTLDLVNAAAFAPAFTAHLAVVPSASRTGTFATVKGAGFPGNRRYWVSYVPSGATLRVMRVFGGSTSATAGGSPPPDTSVARSASSVLEGNNASLRLMTTDGVLRQNQSLATFFGAPVADGRVFDPKVAFDRLGPDQRMYAIALQRTTVPDGKSRIWLAVSRTNDPTTLNNAGWCHYAIDAKRDAGTAQSSWADYPGLGFGSDSLVVTADQHRFTTKAFTFAIVRALNKRTLAHNATGGCPGLPAVHTFQPSVTPIDTKVATLQSVQHSSAPASFPGATNPAYVVASGPGTSSDYGVWRVRNMASGAPRLDKAILHASAGYSPPATAPQKGGAPMLDTLDPRIISATGQGNTLTVAHNTGCNVGGGAVESCVRLLRFVVGQNGAGTPTVTESRLTTIDGGADTFVYHPGVAVDAAGRTAVVFLRSSATRFLGSAWTMQGPVAPAEPVTDLTDGSCHATDPRTGDFTGAALSPAGDSFWIAAEDAATLGGACTWETTVAEVRP